MVFYNPKKIHVPADFILNHYNMNQYEINGLNYFAEEGCGRIFILSTSKKQFKYKGKLLENLNDKQFEVLSFIFNQNNSFIELSDFNKLLSTSTDETYTTLTKRRDLLLKELKTILSVFLELDESTVFKYKKSDTDKRVKLLKLNCITELTD